MEQVFEQGRSTRLPRGEPIAERIREYIRVKLLRPGDRLPSEREFATKFDVTHFAVRMANETLLREGWIAREHGRGTFVGPRAAAVSGGGATPLVVPESRAVGYLAVGSSLSGYTLEQYRRMEAMARAEGMRLVFGNVSRSDPRPIPQNFADELVSGFIVDGDFDEAYLQSLRGMNMPIVVAGNHPHVPGVTQIHMDVASLYRQVVLKLAAAGREFIWLSLESLRLFYTREALRGYRDGMQEARLAPELIILGDEAEPYPYSLVRQLAQCRKLFGPRQAILYGNVLSPLLRALEAESVDVNAFEVVSITRESGRAPQWCSELWFPLERVAEYASRLLFDLLRGKRILSMVFVPTVTSEKVNGHLKLHVEWSPREEVES